MSVQSALLVRVFKAWFSTFPRTYGLGAEFSFVAVVANEQLLSAIVESEVGGRTSFDFWPALISVSQKNTQLQTNTSELTCQVNVVAVASSTPEHALLSGSARSLLYFLLSWFFFTLFFSQIHFSVLYKTAKIVNMTNSQQGELFAELTLKKKRSTWLVYLAGPLEIRLTRLRCCLPECPNIQSKVACFKLAAFGKVTPGGSSCCSFF